MLSFPGELALENTSRCLLSATDSPESCELTEQPDWFLRLFSSKRYECSLDGWMMAEVQLGPHNSFIHSFIHSVNELNMGFIKTFETLGVGLGSVTNVLVACLAKPSCASCRLLRGSTVTSIAVNSALAEAW